MSKHILGVDVSDARGDIDWAAAEATGRIDFAMLRAGFGRNNADEKWVRNYTEVEKRGIPYGVYWFSYAYNLERAAKEADYCITALEGRSVDLPVAWDFEYDSVAFAKKNGVIMTKTLATQMAEVFLDKIRAAGFIPMLYTNAYYLQRYFDARLLDKYEVWLAQWVSTPNLDKPPRSCGIWQYSNVGKIDGIPGNVDLDVLYTDYTGGNIMRYHTRDDIKSGADWALATFDKLVERGSLKGESKDDYNLSRDMLRLLTIFDREGVFDKGVKK